MTETGKQGESPTELTELDRDECLQMLAASHLGRLAVNAPGWPPMIRPVTFVFDTSTQSVVFRSARGSKLTALLRSERAAFEVDDLEPAGQTGWSVIVQGPVEEITNPSELARLSSSGLRPLVQGDLSHWMRIRATVVSGRRIRPSA